MGLHRLVWNWDLPEDFMTNQTWTLVDGYLISPRGRRISLAPISKYEAESTSPGIRAKTSLDRAIVFLRMLIGERRWEDGYDRKIDDCFEMNDGAEVVRHVVEIAEAVPAIRSLIVRHQTVGEKCYAEWLDRCNKVEAL